MSSEATQQLTSPWRLCPPIRGNHTGYRFSFDLVFADATPVAVEDSAVSAIEKFGWRVCRRENGIVEGAHLGRFGKWIGYAVGMEYQDYARVGPIKRHETAPVILAQLDCAFCVGAFRGEGGKAKATERAKKFIEILDSELLKRGGLILRFTQVPPTETKRS